jgi:hypothetical protein
VLVINTDQQDHSGGQAFRALECNGKPCYGLLMFDLSTMPPLSRRAFLTTATVLMAGMVPHAQALDLRSTPFEVTGHLARLDPYLLYAVSYVESRLDRRGRTGPWPYAVRTPRESYYPPDFNSAMQLLASLPSEEVADADLGWMQVNVRWHGNRVPDISHLLHPDINMRVGAGILREAINSLPRDLELAVGRYHTWLDEPRARNYGRRVLDLRARLRAETTSIQ